MNQYENLVSVHDVTDSADLGGLLFLDFGPVFGSAYATWRLFLRPSLTSLLKWGDFLLIKLPFPVHVHQVNPWADALASVVEQDL